MASCDLDLTGVFMDGKTFQNRRVSSPAPVTIVCRRQLMLKLLFLQSNDIFSIVASMFDLGSWVHIRVFAACKYVLSEIALMKGCKYLSIR